MAWAEQRGGSWRIVFRYQNAKHSFSVGEIGEADAEAFCGTTEELLRLLKRNIVTLPDWCGIEEFMLHRGKPPAPVPTDAEGKLELTLNGLRDAYIESQQGKLEETTLAAIRLHFGHLLRLLGGDRSVAALKRPDLQGYVDKRAGEWIDPNVYRAKRRELDAAKKPRSNRKSPPPACEDRPKRHPSAATVRKEIVSLRTAWNWARTQLGLKDEFPGRALGFAKTEESLPFMTWDEAERRIGNGDDPEKVWECVYLRAAEVRELLEWVKGRPVSPWVHPMFCFAAHTGARRSEIVRVSPADLDLDANVVTIREKKRDKRRHTTRRVPLTPVLKEVLREWLTRRANGKTLFCKEDGREITPREAHNYFDRAVRTSKWNVLKGWHVFRHSFISALASKGIDQRVIDDMVGHSTDEQRRRYRHLYPDIKQKAVKDLFGDVA
jgi:integrase